MQYGLIGEKLSHSFSKEIHGELADYTYEICEIARDDLGTFFEKRDFRAINVTMPYKNATIPFLDEISDEAKELGAVNVVINRGGKLFGYNTDYLGLRDMVLRTGVEIGDKKVLILGTGGTARTSALVVKNLGAREIILVSRCEKEGAITYDRAYADHTDADVIINATPVGMYPDPYTCPINVEKFKNLCALFDVIYNPLSTLLVQRARNMGAVAEGGLYMLVSQAAHAVELFLDTKIDTERIESIYEKILKSKENIVLIGMPASGKTTVGRILADSLGREMLDLDDEIESQIGCTISEFFREHSESDFRDIETQITKEASKKNGVVIATGGGAVLRSENVEALRSNGVLFFIDRNHKALIPSDTRPLASQRSDIEKLYQLRYPIYKKVCHIHVDGNSSPNEVAALIREEF